MMTGESRVRSVVDATSISTSDPPTPATKPSTTMTQTMNYKIVSIRTLHTQNSFLCHRWYRLPALFSKNHTPLQLRMVCTFGSALLLSASPFRRCPPYTSRGSRTSCHSAKPQLLELSKMTSLIAVVGDTWIPIVRACLISNLSSCGGGSQVRNYKPRPKLSASAAVACAGMMARSTITVVRFR